MSERTRTFSWQDPMVSADVSGRLSEIEVLRAIVDGSLLPPPIAQLLAMTVEEVQEGRVVFALEPAEWMYNPIGSVHGGVAATILDSCMGCAVHSPLPAGVGYSTADLQVRHARGMTVDTGRVIKPSAVGWTNGTAGSQPPPRTPKSEGGVMTVTVPPPGRDRHSVYPAGVQASMSAPSTSHGPP